MRLHIAINTTTDTPAEEAARILEDIAATLRAGNRDDHSPLFNHRTDRVGYFTIGEDLT